MPIFSWNWISCIPHAQYDNPGQHCSEAKEVASLHASAHLKITLHHLKDLISTLSQPHQCRPPFAVDKKPETILNLLLPSSSSVGRVSSRSSDWKLCLALSRFASTIFTTPSRRKHNSIGWGLSWWAPVNFTRPFFSVVIALCFYKIFFNFNFWFFYYFNMTFLKGNFR